MAYVEPAVPEDRETGTQDTSGLDQFLRRLRAVDDRAWTDEALCKGKTNLFYAPVGERRTKRTRREALAASYCDLCPVADECRASARANRENGMWGGENEEVRASQGFGPRSPNRRAVSAAARLAATST